MLACVFEAAGLSTVMLTMMPFWSERVGLPRSVAVEFPFAQPVGQAHNRDLQISVLRDTLRVLETATAPDAIVELPYEWPEDQKFAYKNWQPKEPTPITQYHLEHGHYDKYRNAPGG